MKLYEQKYLSLGQLIITYHSLSLLPPLLFPTHLDTRALPAKHPLEPSLLLRRTLPTATLAAASSSVSNFFKTITPLAPPPPPLLLPTNTETELFLFSLSPLPFSLSSLPSLSLSLSPLSSSFLLFPPSSFFTRTSIHSSSLPFSIERHCDGDKLPFLNGFNHTTTNPLRPSILPLHPLPLTTFNLPPRSKILVRPFSDCPTNFLPLKFDDCE
ncbi:uncharacterized protein BO95DRAFT_265894 [Aspergillus brunneoviolaceus CBS 621.78]|uniref:Uncharacterized protein n=1 Tax=Aspergillus brunneoviolaceus CBS 621.78 TaxID=1450534 RepID=A0ACD1FWQ7_9EURO|nr:hypothetical protein BO95DRAFT_265894 [Aspergillus brunneoviolaceus CBS 621.78]RAH41407.1 hypothetical protein BO95DRAFT_265894 [Aspergillus brunneoviolaceus CBS 621.78]